MKLIFGYNVYFAEYPFGNQWSIFPMIDLKLLLVITNIYITKSKSLDLNTTTAGPPSHTSSQFSLNFKSNSPPKTSILIGLCKLNDLYIEYAEAIDPEPHESTTSSIPFSYVITLILLFDIFFAKFTLSPSGLKIFEYLIFGPNFFTFSKVKLLTIVTKCFAPLSICLPIYP